MNEVRIQKYIADCGIASRRAAEELISNGSVTVNGEAAVTGQKIDPERDEIRVMGELAVRRVTGSVYVLLYKPPAVLSTARDEKGRKTVLDLVKIPGRRLFPVGRLDMYSEGLIILTDDGDFAQRIIHPSGAVSKTYEAEVNGAVTADQLASLSAPIEIDGRMTAPAEVVPLAEKDGATTLKFTIFEGRNRQIRRLSERAGLKIRRLTRTRIGEITADGLRPGKWRYLTERETEYLKGIQ